MERKPISGFERYEIRDDGTVYDTKRNAILSTWVDNVGYKQCYMRGKDGKKHIKAENDGYVGELYGSFKITLTYIATNYEWTCPKCKQTIDVWW